jgi:hypothetical protein
MTPTLEQRVAALEQRELKLHDLPLKQLLDKLEQDWTPDARTLLLKKSIDADKLADAETWHTIGATGEPAYAGAWANYGTTRAPAGFRKDITGRVYLRGAVALGVITTTAFTLPTGYRPPYDVAFAVASNSAFGYVYVNTVGNVTPQVGSNVWVSLDGISFTTD